MSETGPTRPGGEIVLYQPQQDSGPIRVLLEGDSVWLTQTMIAELYQTTKQNIRSYIQNIYDEGELAPEATVKKYLTVRREGSRQVTRTLRHYDLNAIPAVGYRVRSPVATRPRLEAAACGS